MSQLSTEDLPIDRCDHCGAVTGHLASHMQRTHGDYFADRPALEPADFAGIALPYAGTGSHHAHVPGIGGEPLCATVRETTDWRYDSGDHPRFERVCCHCLDAMARRYIAVGHVRSWGEST